MNQPRHATALLDAYKLANPDITRKRDHKSQDTNFHRLDALEKWLNPTSLQLEFESLEGRFQVFKDDKTFYKDIGNSVNEWISTFMATNIVQNDCTGFLQCSPVDDRGLDKKTTIAIQAGSIKMLIRRATEAAKTLPTLTANGLCLDILQSSMRWQECRNYLIIGDFLTSGVEKIVNVLTHAHKHLDSISFHSDYGSSAELVCKLHEFFHTYQQSYRAKTLTKQDKFVDIPWDLYGLRPVDTKSAPRTSRPRPPIRLYWKKAITNGPGPLYKILHRCLKKLLIDELVLPYLSQPKYRKGKRSLNDEELLVACQLRGILLQCIVEELEDEDFCATSGVLCILQNPLQLFSAKISTETKLLSKILKDPEGMLDPIRNWIRNNCPSDISNITGAIARFVNHRMVEFHVGKSMEDFNPTPDDEELNVDVNPPKLEVRSTRFRPPMDDLSISITTLTGNKKQISLGIPGLIIREALNQRRNLAAGIESLRFFLEGRNPGNGRRTTSGDRDQFDPVRRFNRGAELLNDNLPPQQLATRYGLSNLLAWTGTGQGNKTSSFLQHLKEDGYFYSTNLEDCTGVFNRGLGVNRGILLTHPYSDYLPPDMETPPAHISGYLQISNSRIYGTACNTLKLAPTIRGQKMLPSQFDEERIDLVRKFGPYWTSNVEETWINFIGEMLNKDPTSYPGQRKSWSICIDMLIKLKIDGFKSAGLTTMQTANALALSNIVNLPTINELANWIWHNNHLGAFAGLITLGFVLPNRKAVYVALTALFRHLHDHLTDVDKRIIGFDTIFLEHLLCKISRWSKRLKEIKTWAEQAEKRDEFRPHDNEFKGEAFPFPLYLQDRYIEEAIQHLNVS